MQTVLITGVAGFIGSHLAEWLLKAGCKVLGFDNLSTGKLSNIGHLRSEYGDRFRLVVSDCAKRRVIERMVDEADTVMHLAATVGVNRVMEDAVQTIENMRAATATVFDLCAEQQKRVVFTSTSETYGSNPAPEFSEDMDCIIGPATKSRWCYAASKLMDEFLGLAMHRQFGMPLTIVRLFNTVGIRQAAQYGMVLPRFIAQAKAGEPLTVFGDGMQSRCFTWVGDVVDCLVRIAANEKCLGEIVNIGSTQEVSINELAVECIRQTNSRSEITHIPYAQAYGEDFVDMPHRKPNVTKLRGLIGRVPETPLDASIRMIIQDRAYAPNP